MAGRQRKRARVSGPADEGEEGSTAARTTVGDPSAAAPVPVGRAVGMPSAPPVFRRQRSSQARRSAKTEAHVALLTLRNSFPSEAFDGALPPIIMRHQIYTLVEDRTLVDMQLEKLRASVLIRVFNFNVIGDEHGIVLVEDLKKHFENIISVQPSAEGAGGDVALRAFINDVMAADPGISITKEALLSKYHVAPSTIPRLVRCGFLTLRDEHSYWLALPNVGHFLQQLRRGREELLKAIKRSKFKEMLESDLLIRKMKASKLGSAYHVSDLVGSGMITAVPTTSGHLLRHKARGRRR